MRQGAGENDQPVHRASTDQVESSVSCVCLRVNGERIANEAEKCCSCGVRALNKAGQDPTLVRVANPINHGTKRGGSAQSIRLTIISAYQDEALVWWRKVKGLAKCRAAETIRERGLVKVTQLCIRLQGTAT